MAKSIIMPQLGESVVEGTVSKWLVKEGDQVNEYDALLEVNTDKVDSEIPSTASGTVLKILVPEGTTVRAGTVLAWIGQPGEEVEGGNGGEPQTPREGLQESTETPVSAVSPVSEDQVAQGSAPPAPAVGRDRDLGFISPVVARIARERGVDLQQVTGTGEGGRITKKDVLAHLERTGGGQAAPEPAAWETPGEGDLFRPTELQFGTKPQNTAAAQQGTAGQKAPVQPAAPQPAAGMAGDQILPLNTMRNAIAAHMVNSKHTSPHVTTVMEADLSRVFSHRAASKAAFERDGANLTFTAYFVAATTAALKAFPLVNSSWTEEGVALHAPINIGMAVALGEDGLIVPVIKNADGLSLLGIARAVNDLATRARARRLQPDEVKGGTFSITNHGTGGSLFATPIINQPQCAILGVGTIQKRPVVVETAVGDALAIKPMVYLSLTFDHRILDGAAADGFLAKVVEVLQGWQ